MDVVSVLTSVDFSSAKPATTEDTLRLLRKARAAWRGRFGPLDYFSEERAAEVGLYPPLAPSVGVSDVTILSHRFGKCSILSHEFGIEDSHFEVLAESTSDVFVSGRDWQLVAYDAGDCFRAWKSPIAGFILNHEDNRYYYIQREFVSDFPSLILPKSIFGGFPKSRVQQVFANSPYIVRKYFEIEGEYYLLSEDSIRASIVRHVSNATGKRFATNDAIAAVEHLLSHRQSAASIFGLSGTSETIMVVAVWLLLGALWVLNRGMRVAQGVDAWLAADVDGFGGKFASLVFAILPYGLSVFGALLYCYNMNIVGFLQGYVWFIDQSLSLKISSDTPWGWLPVPPSLFAFITSFIWWPILYLSADFFWRSIFLSVEMASKTNRAMG